jgi:hypothetical protein
LRITQLLSLLLALSTSPALAAPCQILPYQNQCQGSNRWPVPAGYSADSNGDCQPEPGNRDAVYLGWSTSTAGPYYADPTAAVVSRFPGVHVCNVIYSGSNLYSKPYCVHTEGWTCTVTSYMYCIGTGTVQALYK